MESLHNLELPSSWNDVSVDKFIQLKEVEAGDFVSILSYKMDKLFVLTETDIDSDIWSEINTDQLADINIKLTWLNSQPSISFKNQINDYYFKPLDTLTLGEFIDLEHLFSINYITKLPDICAILYRRNRIDEWGHTIIEPRNYDESVRANEFYKLPIPDVFGILQTYLSFKKKFLDIFEDMFLESDDEPKEVSEEITKDEIEKEKLLTKWSWERIIYMLGNDNSLNFNKVVNLPLIFVFNTLSMRKDLKL